MDTQICLTDQWIMAAALDTHAWREYRHSSLSWQHNRTILSISRVRNSLDERKHFVRIVFVLIYMN